MSWLWCCLQLYKLDLRSKTSSHISVTSDLLWHFIIIWNISMLPKVDFSKQVTLNNICQQKKRMTGRQELTLSDSATVISSVYSNRLSLSISSDRGRFPLTVGGVCTLPLMCRDLVSVSRPIDREAAYPAAMSESTISVLNVSATWIHTSTCTYIHTYNQTTSLQHTGSSKFECINCADCAWNSIPQCW